MSTEPVPPQFTPPKQMITFTSHDETGAVVEMLRIEQGGFYVRGVKVMQGDREAQYVYEAFRAWLYKMGILK